MSATHKITTWNIKWLGNLLRDVNDPHKSEPVRQKLRLRLHAIHEAIREIAPDVLCITEGPAGQDAIDAFVSEMPGYSAIKRPPGDAYGQQGTQWIWFVVRDHLAQDCELLPIKVWQDYTARVSANGEHTTSWPVHRWGEITTSTHRHYRHPQVLVMQLAGLRVELIGGHFKSKLTLVGNFNSDDPAKKRAYIEKTVENRIKLGTEAQNVRYYIDQRFEQEPSPAIMVLGDLNDGPGKELFERQFLFFDLLNNLQGDVFEAEKFLNHALFDYPNNLRWTVTFNDKIDRSRDPRILLDHIMFTQAFVRGAIRLRVHARAGKVEHEIFDRINALLPSGAEMSDHKPVSCVVSEH